MKNVLISIAAVAAVSSAALASDSGHELRDSGTYSGKYSEQLRNGHKSSTSTGAFAIVNTGRSLTASERMTRISEENLEGGHSKQGRKPGASS